MATVEHTNRLARLKMIEKDLLPRGINEPRVLAAIESVPRHLFVPEHFRFRAYDDHPLPIGYNQTISQPYTVGLIAQNLRLRGDERVLDIGTGSGYQAAVLSRLAKQVYTLDCVAPFVSQAKRIFDHLNYHNISARFGDGRFGWQEFAPFDAIAVAAWSGNLPQALIDQLAPGGRLVIPIGVEQKQKLKLFVKNGPSIVENDLGDCAFVPLVQAS